MNDSSVALAVKMLESLPESSREKLVERLREQVAEERDELEWDKRFRRDRQTLAAAARDARRHIRAGRARPMDFDKL